MGTSAPTFFATPAAFRAWLRKNHTKSAELIVGFYKKATGRPSITWPESVDEALCVGWIDGIRRRIDDESYSIRFTPRRSRSKWSAVNVARVAALEREGRMQPAGLRAFELRTTDPSRNYSYEDRESAELDTESEARFRSNDGAWSYFRAQAPSYRRTAIWWVVSAKRPDTRMRRLGVLIEKSAKGERAF